MPAITPIVLKYLDLIGIVIFVGLSAFKMLVFLPAVNAISDFETREALKTCEAQYAGKIIPRVILTLILLQGVILVDQIERMTGGSVAQAIPSMRHWLTGTFPGLLWVSKLFVLLSIGFLSRLEIRRRDFLLLVLGLVLCLGATLSGHALTGKIHALVMTDWLHFTAVAIWVGALLPLRRMVRRYGSYVKAEQQGLFLRKLVENFSLLGILAVSIIIITGAFNAMIYMGSEVFVFGTQYAKVFALKLCFVFIVFSLGGLARFYILPRLQAKEGIERTPFLRLQGIFLSILTFELFFVTGVLILAALLTQIEIPG